MRELLNGTAPQSSRATRTRAKQVEHLRTSWQQSSTTSRSWQRNTHGHASSSDLWSANQQLQSLQSSTSSYVGKPPGNEESCSAWDVPDIAACLQRTDAQRAHFNTCAYQLKSKERHYKPGVWAGRLQDLSKLSKVCRCPAWVKHVQLVGKEKTAAAAEHPAALAEQIAVDVVNTWKRILNLEWWRYQVETKSQEVNEPQRSWLENEEKKARGETQRIQASKRAASMAFKIENIEEDELQDSAKARPLERLEGGTQHNMCGWDAKPSQKWQEADTTQDSWWEDFKDVGWIRRIPPEGLGGSGQTTARPTTFGRKTSWSCGEKHSRRIWRKTHSGQRKLGVSPPLSKRTCGRRGEKKQRILMGASLTWGGEPHWEWRRRSRRVEYSRQAPGMSRSTLIRPRSLKS